MSHNWQHDKPEFNSYVCRKCGAHSLFRNVRPDENVKVIKVAGGFRDRSQFSVEKTNLKEFTCEEAIIDQVLNS